MIVERITSEGLAHHSYFIADEGEAAVIDPRRDVDAYSDAARRASARIKWVLETHRHEDFISGAVTLAQRSGATVVHGRGIEWGYGRAVNDGEVIGIGRLRIQVIATPGHTDESVCFTLADARVGEEALMVFTGDTLFVGEVGRTDLYGPAEVERLATALHRSLHRLFALGDGVIVYPAHGAGSVCGGDISDRDTTTLGFERIHNPAITGLGLGEFVARKREERLTRPGYFTDMEARNRSGDATPIEWVPPLLPLALDELDEEVRSGAALIDARTAQAFAGGHIPGSLSVWLDGLPSYLPWAAGPERRIVLILPTEVDTDRVARMLLRIGYDNVGGVLRGGFERWQNAPRPFATIPTISADKLRQRLADGDALTIVDVREPQERTHGTIPGALEIFVGELEGRLGELPRGGELVTMCSVGNRGSLAASMLARRGRRVLNFLGGYNAWKRTERAA